MCIYTYIMQQHKEPSKILHCIFSSLLMHNLGQDLTTHVKHKIPLINRLYKFANCPVFPKKKEQAGKKIPTFLYVGLGFGVDPCPIQIIMTCKNASLITWTHMHLVNGYCFPSCCFGNVTESQDADFVNGLLEI